ncbi:MAG: hypothetical protein LBQ60_12860 [Bacteroidales bacterium]|jgi:hypothetical protein|nr:hypothetical protein [Bacteroidales bacterium]
MELRREIEPQWEKAEKIYPEVLGLIIDYTNYCDINDDVDMTEYKKLEETLTRLTGKDMSQFNLWEWWEEEGAEVLAFRICLPDPQKVEAVTRDELTEIVARIFHSLDLTEESDGSFKAEFSYYIGDYYHDFLKLNFEHYSDDLFNRQKDKDGNYFEYSSGQIVEKIWNTTK